MQNGRQLSLNIVPPAPPRVPAPPPPPYLDRLRAGQSMTRHYWRWLQHYLIAPLAPCPF